jgi:hypothetical protein
MSNVHSVRTGSASVSAPQRAEMIALAIVLLIFGALAWIVGGKYTVEGWTDWMSRFGQWIGLVSAPVDPPRGWFLVGLVIALGALYSLVELLVWRASARRLPLFWIGWLPIVGSDVGSTLFGLVSVRADDPLILQQLAAAWPIALVCAIILTFLPEWMIVGGLKILRR